MEKNYITMSRELEKLRSELTKTPNVDMSAGTFIVFFYTFGAVPVSLHLLHVI